MELKLRYSSRRHAAWTRVKKYGAGDVGTAFIRGSSNTYSVNMAGYPDELKWTRMVSFSQVVKGCYMVWNETMGQYFEECTGSH